MEGRDSNSDDEAQPRMDIIGNLPPEIVQNISLYLTAEQFDNAWNCCERWRYLLDRNYYWRRRCRQKGYSDTSDLTKSVMFQKYLRQFRYHWQAVYRYHKLYSNFKNAIYRRTNIGSETERNLKFYQFDDKMLLVRTNNFMLTCMNQVTGKNDYVLLDERELVTFSFRNNRLIKISGNDKLLTVLDYSNMKPIYKKLFEQTIDYIKTYKNIIGILDACKTFCILNIETQELQCKHYNVTSMCIKNDLIVLAKCKGIIEVFNLSYIKLKTFNCNPEEIIKHVLINNEYLISQTGPLYMNSAYVYDLNNEDHLYKIPLSDVVWYGKDVDLKKSCLHSNNSFTYGETSSIPPTTFITVDLPTGNELFRIVNNPNDDVLYIKANERFIFMMMVSYAINMWCSRSGVPITTINNCFNYYFEITETKVINTDFNGILHVRDYEIDLER